MNGSEIKYNLSLDALTVDTTSMYSLETELAVSSRQVAEYGRMLSQAIKDLDTATMEYEITVAEVVDEICTENNVSPSGRPEVRKSRAPLDKRWQKSRRKLIEATSLKNDIQAIVYGLDNKKFRLSELFKLKLRELGYHPEDSEEVHRNNKERPETGMKKAEETIVLP